MKTIQFPLEYKEGTRLIKYPEAEGLFKKGIVVGDMVACDYYGENLDDYEPYYRFDELLLDITLSGGDGDTPIGIRNNGIDIVNIAYELKNNDGILAPVDGSFRVVLRDSDELVYDMIKIDFVSGAGSVDYSTTFNPAIVFIDGQDLSIPGLDVTITIEKDQYIKIYREL